MKDDERSKAIVAEFHALADKLRANYKRPTWSFDPQQAVDLLFGKQEDFQFERAVHLYLFFIWCMTPKTSLMKSIAASVALNITTQKMLKKALQGKRFIDHQGLANRASAEWYGAFSEQFASKVGGIANALNAPRLQELDRWRKEAYVNQIRAMAIIEYLEKSLNVDPQFSSRARVRDAFRDDLLCKGSAFYKSIGDKRNRKLLQDAEQGKPILGLGKTKLDELWDEAPSTIILLYVLNDIIGPETTNFFSDLKTLHRLDSDAELLSRIKKALRRYELICQKFAARSESGVAVKKWRPVQVPSIKGAKLAAFTPEQRKRFDALRSQHPARTAGSRK